MKLKTYTAETMAQALGQVRKDLGKDAMILHTRSFRVGAWFGLGGKTMVEITASSSSIPGEPAKAPRVMPRVAQPAPARVEHPVEQLIERQPEIVIQRGRTVTRQRLAHAPVGSQTEAPREARAGSINIDQPQSAPNQQADLTRDDEYTGRDALFADELRNRTGASSAKPVRPIKPQRPAQFVEPKPAADSPGSDTEPYAEVVIPKTKLKINKPHASVPPAPKNPSPEAPPETNPELKSQIDTLSKMMGQVLESTRKTAVAVGTGNSDAALPNGEMPAPLFELYAKMLDNDVPVELADSLVGSVRDRLDALELKDPQIVRQALLRAIELTIETRSESLLTFESQPAGRPRVIALVGPTGVGKTTTVAKLAATYKLRHGKKVGLITSDTYRIAAVEQLRTYAGIIDLPLKVANTPEELGQAVADFGDCDVVVIDTAGRSQFNTRRLEELAEFTAAANPDETHLVLSTTVGDNVLRKTAQSFKALGPDRCILTKLDEAVTTGPIAGLSHRIGLPLSFITIGQEVPDDLEPARADRLARCVLDGPEAVVRRWSEDNG